MYQTRYYDETLSEEEDQEMIEEILGAPPLEQIPMNQEKRYQIVGEPFSETDRQLPNEKMYQLFTQELPLQSKIFTTLSNENWDNNLLEPLKPFSETPMSFEKKEPTKLKEKDTVTENVNSLINLPRTNYPEYPINEDPSPEIIRKAPQKELVYTQEISIRYLRPPTPPEHGEIEIKEEQYTKFPPAPPVHIRQQPKRPDTPPVLVIREQPPKAPQKLPKKVIVLPGKKLPPPPRKVIVERLPQTPQKPQNIIIERWLQYEEPKRKIVYIKPTDIESFKKPKEIKNLIIQWDSPRVVVKKQIVDLGVIKTDPDDYMAKYGSSLKNYDELPDFIRDMKPPENLYLASGPNRKQSSLRLEGDLDALRLVDLEKEGLTQYSSFIDSEKEKSSVLEINRNQTIYEWDTPYEEFQPSISDELMFEQVLYTVQPKNKQVLTINEARVVMKLINEKKGRLYNENEAEKLLSNLCPNKEDWIDIIQFKRALFKVFS